MKKIRSSSKTVQIEYEVYSYLTDEEAEEHCKQMISNGWYDESWNNDNVLEYDDEDIEYTTIRYRKEIILAN